MRTHFFLFLLLLWAIPPLRAQEPKGATPNPQSVIRNPQSTRAVVVGISDYQVPAIPDLRFADRDAEAFAQYLRSPAGGNVPDANIKLLTNEKATMAAVAAALDWLVEVSNAGDQAIIYFSGHGDVEAKTSTQPGFLLTYDSPPKVYIAGAYPLFYLQLIVQTLSTDKNVQTLVITDACHAGKLAGSNIGGAQATAANLANPAELEKRWKGDTAYGQYPRYLQGAAELLGEKHYMYNYLLAKKLYFEGLDIRLKADRGSTLQQAIEKQKAALALEPRAAFLYNELGLLYTQLNVSQEAIEYLHKAMEIAPTWGLPQVNICSALARLKRYDEAIEYAYKTIELMPDNSSVYNFLAWFLTQGPWRTEAGFAANVGIDLQQNPTIAWDFMLTAAQRKKAIEFKPDSMTDEQAIRMAEAYLKLGKPEAGKAIFPEKLKSENTRELLAAGKLFWLEMAKYLYVQMKIRQGEKEIAIRLFSEILAKDWFVEYLLFGADRALDPIRQTEPFRRLMRRYFPEKAKD